MKRLLVILCMAAMAFAGQKPIDVPAMAKSYHTDRDKVFSAMVQAVSGYDVTVMQKDACFIQFTMHERYAATIFTGPQVDPMTQRWSVTCSDTGTGFVTVKLDGAIPLYPGRIDALEFTATENRGAPGNFVRSVMQNLWYALDVAIPEGK